MDVPSDILSKLERYCAYQERCEADVRKKLFSIPCSVAQRDEIIRRLKEHDFLNETRFVESFVRSKIHEQWGRLKIRQSLSLKGVDPQLVSEQLARVDDCEYEQILAMSVEKWRRLHPTDAQDRSKLIRHLLSKGFEMDLIMKIIRNE